jgi:hypothetical protein
MNVCAAAAPRRESRATGGTQASNAISALQKKGRYGKVAAFSCLLFIG